MKTESHTITINPFFLQKEEIFNLKTKAVTESGKVHAIEYSVINPRKKKPKTIRNKKVDLPLDKLIKIVADYFKVSVLDIKGDYRGGNILKARQIYCYIARQKMGIRVRIIAASVNRLSCNITHTCKAVDLIERNINDRVTRKEHYQNVMSILNKIES